MNGIVKHDFNFVCLHCHLYTLSLCLYSKHQKLLFAYNLTRCKIGDESWDSICCCISGSLTQRKRTGNRDYIGTWNCNLPVLGFGMGLTFTPLLTLQWAQSTDLWRRMRAIKDHHQSGSRDGTETLTHMQYQCRL